MALVSTLRLTVNPPNSTSSTSHTDMEAKKLAQIHPLPNTIKVPPSLVVKPKTHVVNLPVRSYPDSSGKFGRYGGKFAPETLMSSLALLEQAFLSAKRDPIFRAQLHELLNDYAGRETPLYFAEKLTNHYKRGTNFQKGPQIYFKREDLNHTGSNKIISAVAQALLAKRLGKTRIVAETGAGQHGVATASICARLGMECVIYMGTRDMSKHVFNVRKMKLLGAEVKEIKIGTSSLRDATSEAFKDALSNMETTHLILSSAIGPHPYPLMAREFNALIGKETRKQAVEKWGGKPHVLLACVGGGSNAIGLFHEFIGDEDVRLIGVEAAGLGLESGKHAASLCKGERGVLHGSMCYMLQDEEGQIVEPYSICGGMAYPGVGAELSHLKDVGRIECYSVSDEEAVAACKRVSRLEGIIPALETSHAFAYLEKLCPTLPDGAKVVVNCSGHGDKDIQTVLEHC